VGRAQSFDGAGDYIDLPAIAVPASMTVIALLRADGDSLLGATGYNTILSWKGNARRLLYGSSGVSLGKLLAQVGIVLFSTTAYPRGAWQVIAFKYDSSVPQSRWTVDGVPDAAVAGGAMTNMSGYTSMLGMDRTDYCTNGPVCELRLSSVARSAEWNAAEDAWLRTNSLCYEMGPLESYESVALDALLVDRLSTSPSLGAVLEEPAPVRGLLHVDAVGLLAQLDKEVVHDYTATEKATNTIVTELLALQQNPNPIVAGTISPTTALSISVDDDTILGVLRRIQESVGGYIYIDVSTPASPTLEWSTTLGSNTGQQLRFGKNLVNIRRTVDYTDLANRLWCWGYGDGEAEVRLGKGIVTVQPQAAADLAQKWYDTAESAWTFQLGNAPGPFARKWQVGWPYTTQKKYGGGVRFPNVIVPQGATILKAELRLTAHADVGTGANVDTKVYAEDADDAAQFSNVTDYDARTPTAKVDWDDIASWSALQVYARDITTSVQAVIDRIGWASGNALVVFFEDHDGASTQYHSRKTYLTYGDTKSPTLYVEYTLPGAVDYVEDLASQEAYGFVAAALKDVSITDSATLFEWAVRKLGEMAYPGVSYAGDIADLERYGFAHDALSLGNTVRVMDEGISLDVSTSIVRLVRNLVNRMDVKVELANRAKTILDKTQFSKDPRWRQHFY
jgi:hypothetical protein